MKKLLIIKMCLLPLTTMAQVQKSIVKITGNAKETNGSPFSGVVIKALERAFP